MSRLCGTHAPAEQVAAAESHFAEHRVAVDTSSLTAADVNLNVYWHVVSKDTTEDGGNVPCVFPFPLFLGSQLIYLCS